MGDFWIGVCANFYETEGLVTLLVSSNDTFFVRTYLSIKAVCFNYVSGFDVKSILRYI
jgi:hypothetical protein